MTGWKYINGLEICCILKQTILKGSRHIYDKYDASSILSIHLLALVFIMLDHEVMAHDFPPTKYIFFELFVNIIPYFQLL